MILYEKVYEREGNDSWLKDQVQINDSPMGLFLEHKYNWSGWAGDSKGSNTLELDEYDMEGAQKKVDDFIEKHGLFDKFPNGDEDGIKINLKELLTFYLLFKNQDFLSKTKPFT